MCKGTEMCKERDTCVRRQRCERLIRCVREGIVERGKAVVREMLDV